MNAKTFFKDLGKGAAIGASCLIPGISGGTIALFFRVYHKIINNVSSLTSRFKESFLTLLPIIIGVVLGVIGMWYPLHLALKYFMFGTLCIFAGFIIGGIPSLMKPLNGQKVKASHVISFVLSLGFVIALTLVSYYFHLNADSQFVQPYKVQLYFELIALGVLGAFALVIPGISGSMIFLILGFYDNILGLVENIKTGQYIGQTIGLLACLALGILIGVILVSKLLKKFIAKYELIFTWGILGFVIGSIFSIFYNDSCIKYFQDMKLLEGIIGGLLLVIGFLAVLFLSKIADKKLSLTVEENSTKEEQNVSN